MMANDWGWTVRWQLRAAEFARPVGVSGGSRPSRKAAPVPVAGMIFVFIGRAV
jgi:hypothetical protein